MNSSNRSPNPNQANGQRPEAPNNGQVPELNILKTWRSSRQGFLTTRFSRS